LNTLALEVAHIYADFVMKRAFLDIKLFHPIFLILSNIALKEDHVLYYIVMRLYLFFTFSLPVIKMLNCRPYTILAKGLIGTARSSLFLSVYCASAWLASCSLHYYFFAGCLAPKLVLIWNKFYVCITQA